MTIIKIDQGGSSANTPTAARTNFGLGTTDIPQFAGLNLGGFLQEIRISSVNVNIGLAQSDTTLLTVPAFKNFVVTKVIAYNSSTDLSSGLSTFSIGIVVSSTYTKIIDNLVLTGLVAARNYVEDLPIDGAIAALAGDVIIARPTVGVGTSQVRVDLFGYYLA